MQRRYLQVHNKTKKNKKEMSMRKECMIKRYKMLMVKKIHTTMNNMDKN